MSKNVPDSEMKLAENMAIDIQREIQMHYIRNCMSGGFIQAEVLVPMTENVNMEFEIYVPKEMMDEDNTALLEYFAAHIYQPEDGEYMTESIHHAISQKERDLQKLQENVDNFDAEAFMADPDKYLMGLDEESEEPVDLLDTPIDGELENNILQFEMAGQIPGEAKISGKPKKPGLIIAMGSNERNIHHFHVYRCESDLQKWANGACLFLDDNRYYDHKNNAETLSDDELKAVVAKLRERYPNERFNGTNWDFLVELWNANNHRYPVDPNLKMPEYNYKTITRYKEK